MNVYFDTEFTGLSKDTTLISIGLVAEDGSMFYGIFTDYNRDLCDDWIKENVIDNLYLDENLKLPQLTIVEGTKEDIRKSLITWFMGFGSEIQLVSDVCHYDMMLLIDIFGTAFDLPEYVSPVCHDISQDLARVYKISDRNAFDISRRDIVKAAKDNNFIGSYSSTIIKQGYLHNIFERIEMQDYLFTIHEDLGNKHNALFDAIEIAIIYNYLNLKV